MIRYLADYLVKPDNDLQEAFLLVLIFSLSVFIGCLIRNFYIYQGYMMALELRKLLIAAMYDKVGKLSIRSLT